MKPYKSEHPSPADIPWDCCVCAHNKVNMHCEPCKSCYDIGKPRLSNWTPKKHDTPVVINATPSEVSS